MILRVRKLNENAHVPGYARPGDAGLDLYSCEACKIEPGQSRIVLTGIAIELPDGTEGQVRPRSGLALKHQITVLNTPGTIDQGYRGEVGVILINHGNKTFHVEIGMRIAQLVIVPVIRVEVQDSQSLSDTERGSGGFGSTGQ